jgi:hypothetical protein
VVLTHPRTTLSHFQNDGGLKDFLSAEALTMLAPFVQLIETKASLMVLTLRCSPSTGIPVPDILSRILPVISSRVTTGRDPLNSVTLVAVEINADDVITLVRDFRLLVLGWTQREILKGSFPTEEQAIQQVAQSFATNSSILDLSLPRSYRDEAYFSPILNALQSNASMETLSIHNRRCGKTPAWAQRAFVDLLESSVCPIRNLVS